MTAENILSLAVRRPHLTDVQIARLSGWSVRDVALLLGV
jgi:hypothetical protein